MVVSMEHIVSTLIMSTTIIRLFQWKWDYIVATLGTNPYVYKVQSLSCGYLYSFFWNSS